jgi:hypothetical protein
VKSTYPATCSLDCRVPINCRECACEKWSSLSYVSTLTLTMTHPANDPTLQTHLQALEKYKKSLVDPYSQAAQDASALQTHLGTLARYKYMLSKNIDELPSYCNPPDDNETPSQRSRRLYWLEQIPQMISRVCPKNPLLCIVLIFVPAVATKKYP